MEGENPECENSRFRERPTGFPTSMSPQLPFEQLTSIIISRVIVLGPMMKNMQK